MKLERPKSPDRKKEMSDSKRSGGNGDISDQGSDIDEFGRQYD